MKEEKEEQQFDDEEEEKEKGWELAKRGSWLVKGYNVDQ